jgi:hypothetical protein
MLTNTMPAVIKALQKTLDPTTLKAFTQALGNCNQPVTQRGPVAIKPDQIYLRAGEYPGGNTSYGYSTSEYSQYNPTFQNIFSPILGPFNPIFPDPIAPYPIMPPDLGPGDTRIDLGDNITNNINNNINNSSFFFPTTQVFNTFGGPTNNYVSGDTYIDRSVTDNSVINNNRTTNLTVNNINGNPVQGPTGPPGQPGSDGRDGRDGAPGAPGMLVPVPFPVITPPGVPPPPPQPKPIDLGGFIRGAQPFIRMPDITVPGRDTEVYVSTYSFDPATCALTETVTRVPIAIPEVTIPGGDRVNLEGFQLADAAAPAG